MEYIIIQNHDIYQIAHGMIISIMIDTDINIRKSITKDTVKTDIEAIGKLKRHG